MFSFFSLKKMGGVICLTLLTLGLALTAPHADAKRLGGGRSIGRQSYAGQQWRTPPSHAGAAARATPQTPATPPPAAAPRNRWLGPLAGLAAGLGIGALMSHMGLGGAFGGFLANMLLLGLIAFAGYWIVTRWFRRDRGGSKDAYEPTLNTSHASPTPSASPFSSEGPSAFAGTAPTAPPAPTASYRREAKIISQTQTFDAATDLPAGAPHQPHQLLKDGGTASAETGSRPKTSSLPVSIPSDFDEATFLRMAKVRFIRLQAAWDAGDLDDIRKFTNAEMFAEIQLDLTERGTASNYTKVMALDADLLDVQDRDATRSVSVRFSGLINEGGGHTTEAEPFAEVWNFTKRANSNCNDGSDWMLAGIQQIPQVS